MWLIQKRPLDDTWRMHSSLILDVPSMNPRGRSILDEDMASHQMNSRRFISTISSAHLDKPPDYYDALVQSKPISWYLTTAKIASMPKPIIACGHNAQRDDSNNGPHVKQTGSNDLLVADQNDTKLEEISEAANISTVCLSNTEQDKPYHRKRSLCLQCINKCKNNHKQVADAVANDIMLNNVVNNGRSCVVDLNNYDDRNRATNFAHSNVSTDTDHKINVNIANEIVQQRAHNGRVTQIALNLMKGIGSNYRIDSHPYDQYNNLKYNRRRSSPLDGGSPIPMDQMMIAFRQCDNLTKGVEYFSETQCFRENSFYQLDARQLNQVSDFIEPPSYTDLVRRGLVED